MKKPGFLFVLLLSSAASIAGKVIVETPASATVTTRDLALHLSNQLDGLPNNDAVSYIAFSVTNKSSHAVKLAAEEFVLKDETGAAVPRLLGKEALKIVVDWNYERANSFIKIGDADLRDVLRISNEPTTAKALTEIELKPQEEVKNKAVFFPKLPAGEFILELRAEKVQIRVSDGVYFVRPETPKAEVKASSFGQVPRAKFLSLRSNRIDENPVILSPPLYNFFTRPDAPATILHRRYTAPSRTRQNLLHALPALDPDYA